MNGIARPSKGEVDRFRAAIVERLGLHFDDDKLDGLARVLCARTAAAGASRVDAYLKWLLVPSGARAEWRALARELTIGETYFFRHAAQLDVFCTEVLLKHSRRTAGRRRMQILSAGCSSGEEAYSLAILVHERCPEIAPLVTISGIDANEAAIAKAMGATYSSWSLRETTDDIRKRYFSPHGRDVVLAERVRRMVTFEVRNLVDDDASFWRPGTFDAVFCRNVIMYFTPDVARGLVGRIARSLIPGGSLFLGHAETLRGLSDDFDLRHTGEAFFYEVRDASPPQPSSRLVAPSPTTSAPLEVAPSAMASDAWLGAIRRASERIEALARSDTAHTPSPEPPTVTTSAPTDAWSDPGGDVEAAMELLRQERFADALACLRRLPASALDSPGPLLLYAVLLTNTGDSVGAEQACAKLLAFDVRNAGAHYLTALCRERAGAREAAVEHDRAASSLDPSFAMPRLHLGLLARRARDVDTARSELRHALSLLHQEDALRVTLFGGGFQRDALIQLCRAELDALGSSHR